MSNADEASPVQGDVRRAWEITLDEKRRISSMDMGDGTFVFRFVNGANETKIRISREAVNAMKELMLHELGGIDA